MRRATALAVLSALIATGAADARGASAPAAGSAARAPVRTVHAGVGTIGYRAVGHGRPLVLITGMTGTMNAWPPRFIDHLAAAGHRVIALDNEGVGRSTLGPEPLTIARMADNTAALIDALGLRRADVLGWSMGGMIAQALASRHPERVRRLVLAATAPGDGHATFPSQEALGVLAGGSSVGAGAFLDLLFPPGQDAAQRTYAAGFAEYTGPPRRAAPAATIRRQLAASAGWLSGTDPASRPLAPLSRPVLVAAGARDEALPAANDRYLARQLHGHLAIYADAGHGFLFQDADRFLPRVVRFLR